MGGWLTDGLPNAIGPGQVVDALGGLELVPVDTQLASGTNPQTVSATSFDLVAVAAGLIGNVGTVATGTVTLNTRSGLVNTGSLSTAAGSTASFSLVNSLATTGAAVRAGLASGSNTTAGATVQSLAITTSGTVTVTIKNNGTAALNGSLLVPFMVGSAGV